MMLGRVAALAPLRLGQRVSVAGLARGFRQRMRERGWEIRRTDPDRSLPEHLWYLFPHLGVTCVLDVGAGTGEYGEFLRRNGYTGDILSFEPVAESYQRLAERSAPDPRWRAYPFALGGEATTAEINVTRDTRYTSFLRPTEHTLRTFPGSIVERTEPVEVRRLDAVWDDLLGHLNAPVVFLKTTTQGRDLDVLRGAEQHLHLLTGLHAELTFHPLYDGAVALNDSLAALLAAGFGVSGLFDRPHHHGFRLAEVDCVMVRASEDPAEILRRW
jgi:FkbM family methyltransferase